MQNVDRIKKNALQITARLKSLGIVVSSSQILEGLAAGEGYRTWHAYKSVLEASVPEAKAPISAEVWSAIEDAVNSANNTGCDWDLTVTSQSSIERLEAFLDAQHAVPAEVWRPELEEAMPISVYVAKVGEYCPNLKVARRNFPDQEPVYENIKLVLTSQLSLLDIMLAAKP